MSDLIERLDRRRHQEPGITELDELLLDAVDEIQTLRAERAWLSEGYDELKAMCQELRRQLSEANGKLAAILSDAQGN